MTRNVFDHRRKNEPGQSRTIIHSRVCMIRVCRRDPLLENLKKLSRADLRISPGITRTERKASCCSISARNKYISNAHVIPLGLTDTAAQNRSRDKEKTAAAGIGSKKLKARSVAVGINTHTRSIDLYSVEPISLSLLRIHEL